jgi:hypothetical protein
MVGVSVTAFLHDCLSARPMPMLTSEIKSPPHSIAIRTRKHEDDLLIIQTRKLGTTKPSMRLRLRLLGLSGLGTSHLHPSSSAFVRRLIVPLRKSQLVEIHPLALPASTLPADPNCVTLETDVAQTPYDAEGHGALQLTVGQGERLNVEPADGYFSMAWTTALPVVALLRRLEVLLDPAAPVELTIGVDHGFQTTDSPTASAIERLIDAQDDVGFWRLDLEDRTLTWERDETPPMSGGPALGLMGFIGDAFDAGYMENLITATATPMIGANAQTLLTRCDDAIGAAHVSRRHLATG